MTAEATITAEPLEYGYSHVPHGLWTLDVSHGARSLLGWLHSHSPAYLAKLSVSRCETEFGGGGSIRVWFRELEERGFLRKEKKGNRWLITLLAEPWMALHRQRRPAEPAPAESADRTTPAESAEQTRRIGQVEPAESADRGDHPEHQGGDHSDAPVLPPVASQQTPEPSRRGARRQTTPAACRPRNPLFDALVEACGMNYDEMTDPARKRAGVAVAQLQRVGATPEEVHRRAEIYRQVHTASLTPTALSSQWAACRDVPAAPPPRNGPTAFLERWLQEHPDGGDPPALRAVQ